MTLLEQIVEQERRDSVVRLLAIIACWIGATVAAGALWGGWASFMVWCLMGFVAMLAPGR